MIAQIIRRTQLLEMNEPDPFPIAGYNYSQFNSDSIDIPIQTISPELYKGWEEVDSIHSQNHALLRLVYILEQGILLLLQVTVKTFNFFFLCVRTEFKDVTEISY